jgi:hypothetical protein
MDVNDVKQRLELALRLEKPPTLEEVLEEVSTRGVLRGPADWVFPAWIIYVEYAVQKIAKTIQLTEEEKRQLLHFRDTLKRLLLEAWRQTNAKLVSIYKAVVDGTHRVEGGRLYAPDGAWIHVRDNFTPYVPIHGISAKAYFPDILKLPRERLELLQLGWRASDERRPARHVHHTALAGVRLHRDEIRRAPRAHYLGQLEARGGKRESGYHSEELEADMEQGGGHRSGDKPPQAQRVGARVNDVAGRW